MEKEFKVRKLYVLKCVDEREIISFKVCKKERTKIIPKDVITLNDVHEDEIISSFCLKDVEEFKNKKMVTRTELYDYALSEFNKHNTVNISTIDEKHLKEATLKFFPKDGIFTPSMFEKSDRLNKNYLPSHLRDNMWLAQTLSVDQRLYYIKLKSILAFVENSVFFKREREKYELRLIRWQINQILDQSEELFVDDEIGDKELLSSSIDYDILFRNEIVKRLKAIGMNEIMIEKGIEIYSYIWRDYVMKKTFRNRFYPSQLELLIERTDDDKLDSLSEIHENAWLTFRRYNYYKEHRIPINRYSRPTEEMLISDGNAKYLEKELDKMNKERLYYLRKHLLRNNRRSYNIK